jgi:NO-binding membrane sensor protein with MHYT domain
MTNISIAEFLYEEDSFGVFLLISMLLGGGAAWLAGRAIASTWRPWWHVAFYMLILGVAVRFLHFALFDATLLSPQYYLVDTGVCLGLGFLGFRTARAAQMATQYRWINVRTGAFTWDRRGSEAGSGPADCK